MKILVTPTSFHISENEPARRLLENFADEVVYPRNKRPLTQEEVIACLDGIDGYIAGLDQITANAIEAAPSCLRVISRYGAGVDRVDLAAAARRGITVTNTPGTNSTAVAELSMALMLCCARNIVRLHNNVESGGWMRRQGIELRGKTLGILGLGAIGKKLATFAKAFGMSVKAFDPYIDNDFCQRYDIQACEQAEVFHFSDFLSLHVPLNDSTRHIISSAVIEELKPGCIIINTARGGLVNESAVANAIQSGRLGGIGIDAFEQEPPAHSPLRGLDNVVFTPHTGSHTNEAVAGMAMMAVENLIAVLKGESCPYTVRPIH